jgi:putative flippase GtrA
MFTDVADVRQVAREVVRFAVVGGTGLVANMALLIGFVELFALPEEVAAILSTLLVLVGGFVATNWWVFANVEGRDTTRGLMKRGGSYYVIMLTGKGVNYGIYLLLLSVDVWYPVAWLLGSVTVFIGTFSLNRRVWTKLT